MSTTAVAPSVAASQTSLNTILQTVETGTEVLQKVLPDVAMFGGIVPGGTPFIQLVGLALPVVQNAIKFIMQEEGKSAVQAFQDFIQHISPGGPLSPSLSLMKNADGSFGPT